MVEVFIWFHWLSNVIRLWWHQIHTVTKQNRWFGNETNVLHMWKIFDTFSTNHGCRLSLICGDVSEGLWENFFCFLKRFRRSFCLCYQNRNVAFKSPIMCLQLCFVHFEGELETLPHKKHHRHMLMLVMKSDFCDSLGLVLHILVYLFIGFHWCIFMF